MLLLKLRDVAYGMGHEAVAGEIGCPFRRVDLVYAFAKGFTDGLVAVRAQFRPSRGTAIDMLIERDDAESE
jgi:hypothetical protein